MKKIVCLFILVIMASCGSKKKTTETVVDDSIVYVLPNTVTIALKDKIKNNYNNIYFQLKKGDNYSYILYYDYTSPNNKVDIWVKETKRKLLIDDKIYPLIFDTDETFGVTNSYSNILKSRRNKENIFFDRLSIANNRNSIRFTAKGDILD